jgi:hypothetical protein
MIKFVAGFAIGYLIHDLFIYPDNAPELLAQYPPDERVHPYLVLKDFFALPIIAGAVAAVALPRSHAAGGSS